MGEFFNTQNSRIREMKGLAGADDSPTGKAMTDAIATVMGREGKLEADAKAQEEMKSQLAKLGISSSGKFDMKDVDAVLSIKQDSLSRLQKSNMPAELSGEIKELQTAIAIIKEFKANLGKKPEFIDPMPFLPEWQKLVDENISDAQKRVNKIAEIDAARASALSRIEQSLATPSAKEKENLRVNEEYRNILKNINKEPAISDRQKALNAEYSRLQDVIQALDAKLSKEGELSESEKSALNLTQKAQSDVTKQQVYLLGLKADSLQLAVKETDAMEKNANAIGKVADATEKQVLQLQRELDIFGMTKAQVRAYDSERSLASAKEYAEKLKVYGLTEDLTEEQILQVSLALDSLSYEDRRSIFAGRALGEITRNNQALIKRGEILKSLSDADAGKAFLLEQEKTAKEAAAVWKRFQENVQRNMGDVLYNGLQGKFKDIGDMFKQMLLRMTADAAAARLAQAMFGGTTALFGTAAVAATGAAANFGPAIAAGTGTKGLLGAVIPYAVAAAAVYVVAKYGFGMGNKRENVGGNRLVGEFTREGFSGNRQQSWELDRGGFRSTQRGTYITAVSTAESRALLKTVNDLQHTFDSLGDAIGQTNVRTKQWRVGMDLAGDVTNALSDGLGRSLVPALAAFREAGENLAQTAKRLTTVFQGTSFFITALGLSATDAFGAIGISSTSARQKLIGSAGGLDAFNQSASFFVSNFLTDAQKLAPSLDIIGRTFTDLKITGVETNEQFAALIATQTKLAAVTGDYGTVGRLLGVAEAFNNITGEAKKTTDQLLALIKTNTFSSLVDYQRAVGLASAPGVAGAGAGAMIESATAAAVPVMAAESGANTAIDDLIAQWGIDNPLQVSKFGSPISRMVARRRHERERQAYIDSLLPPMATGTNFLPQDMPIMAHQGERIIPRADNTEIMSRLRNPSENNQALLSELRSLRQEVANLQSANVAIALNTNRSAKMLERFDGNGMPAVREE